MINTELNYSTAEPQNSYSVIPDKTLAKVKMTLKSGGYNEESKGWTAGWATKSEKTGAVYLNAEFQILGGKYDARKVWSLIGLHSEKGDKYREIGASFIRTILESAHAIDSKDKSREANKARTIKSFAELNGMEFIAQIEVKQDQNGNNKNQIRFAITKEHKEYSELMFPIEHNGRYKINKGAAPANGVMEEDELPF